MRLKHRPAPVQVRLHGPSNDGRTLVEEIERGVEIADDPVEEQHLSHE